MPYYTAIVTLLAVAFYFFMATRVAVARGRFGVKHPATSGNLDFERIFRARINTLEWMPTFLVPLWLCAFYFNDAVAAALGLIFGSADVDGISRVIAARWKVGLRVNSPARACYCLSARSLGSQCTVSAV